MAEILKFSKTLVTVGTDGFRDYATLPDGQTYNLGTVSVLKLVTDLVHDSVAARKALDTFLANKQATIAVDLEALRKLIGPKRARWSSGPDKLLVSPVYRTGTRGVGMDHDQAEKEAINNQIASIERQIGLLGKLSKEHAAGSASKEQMENSAATLRQLIADLGKAPSGQSKNNAFYFKLGHVEAQIACMMRSAAEIPGATDVLQLLVRELQASEDDQRDQTQDQQQEQQKQAQDSQQQEQQQEGQDQEKQAKAKLASHTLRSFLETDPQSQRSREEILANLLRKKASGRVDAEAAQRLWKFWVDDGATRLAQKLGSDPFQMFPNEGRVDVAMNISQNVPTFKVEDGTKVAKEPVAPTTMPADVAKAEDAANGKVDDPYKGKDLSNNETYYKLAAAEVPIVNEALARFAMGKVEIALGVLATSKKANVDIAKKDLHVISEKLASVLQEGNCSDPSLRPTFIELLNKTEKVFQHFAKLHPEIAEREKKEMEKMLKDAGYDPADVGKIMKDEIGPEELRHRMKEPGGLTRTHGVRKLKD